MGRSWGGNAPARSSRLEEALQERRRPRPFRSAKLTSLVDPQALDLVEHRRVRGVADRRGRRGRGDDADSASRLAGMGAACMGIAHLHRAGVGAQVSQRPSASFSRRRRCRASNAPGGPPGVFSAVKLIEVGLDLGAVGHLEARCERKMASMRSIACGCTGCRPPRAAAAPGQGDIERLAGQLRLRARPRASASRARLQRPASTAVLTRLMSRAARPCAARRPGRPSAFEQLGDRAAACPGSAPWRAPELGVVGAAANSARGFARAGYRDRVHEIGCDGRWQASRRQEDAVGAAEGDRPKLARHKSARRRPFTGSRGLDCRQS
jgi:hypothetical protein